MATDRRRALIREGRLGNFFIQKIWPLQRRLVKGRLYRRCTRCILNECYTKISPDSGLCLLCESDIDDPKHNDRWRNMNAEFNKIVDAVIQHHSTAQFHALVLFSGGKDSCYMLRRLARDFPEIRILTLTIDNTFMSPIAIENVNLAIEHIGVAHLWVRLPKPLAEKMFRFTLLRDQRDEPMGLVDFMDGELISDIARQVAQRFQIPLIMMGLSSEQVEKILKLETFQRPYDQEYHARSDVAGIDLDEIFTASEQLWWWHGATMESPPAQFLFPLATWDVSEEEIKREVNASGFLEGAILDPLLTNHALIVPMVIMDYIRHGYFTYEPEFAEMIRCGRARRQDWIHVVEVFEYASKTGRVLSPSFDRTLHRLGLDRQTLGIPE